MAIFEGIPAEKNPCEFKELLNFAIDNGFLPPVVPKKRSPLLRKTLADLITS